MLAVIFARHGITGLQDAPALATEPVDVSRKALLGMHLATHTQLAQTGGLALVVVTGVACTMTRPTGGTPSGAGRIL